MGEIKDLNGPIFTGLVQWGSEYRTSLVFKWSKRGWMPKGLVFEYKTAQPFEYWRNGRHLVFLYTGLLFEW